MRDGRLRLRLVGLEWAADAPRLVAETLRAIPGVRNVGRDPVSGEIAVAYEPRATVIPEIVATPSTLPAIRRTFPARTRRPAPILAKIVEAALLLVVEAALHRALGPLWPRRC